MSIVGIQVLSQHRIDPDLADPWAPEIVLAEQPLTMAQSARLSALVNAEPKVALAAVVVGPVPGAAWSLGGDRSSSDRATGRIGACRPRTVPTVVGA